MHRNEAIQTFVTSFSSAFKIQNYTVAWKNRHENTPIFIY